MLERPEDAGFYEWHLVDPKDSPYATFKFHYRSWDNLEQLNLIPPGDLSLPPAGSSGTVGLAPKDDQGSDNLMQHPEDIFSFGVGDTLDGAAFHDDGSLEERVAERVLGWKTPEPLPLRSTPSLLPVSSFNQDFPQPSKALRDKCSASYLRRPLPELPHDVAKGSPSHSSDTSETPSLSPSVMRDVDNGLLEEDFIEVGVMDVIRYTKPTEKPRGVEVERAYSVAVMDTTASASDYEASPPSTHDSNSPGVVSPGAYLVSTGSLLEQHLNSPRFPDSPREISPNVRQGLGDSSDIKANRPRFSLRSLTESEWMRRTPSPVRRARPGFMFGKIWSPRPKRKSAKDYFSGFRQEKVGSRELLVSNRSEFGDENQPPEEEAERRTGR